MKRKRLNRISLFMVLGALLIMAATGCDKQAQHRVLTFFFTGVPSPEEEEKAAATQTVKKEAAAEETARQTARKRPKIVRYSHPLYSANRCDACHDTSASLGFRASGSRGSSRIFGGTGAATPARLRLPVKKLCLECHEDKSAARAATEKLWLHTPAAKGDCLACHNPHQSRNPYMLHKKPGELCLKCHLEDVVMNARSHNKLNQDLTNCLGCHNPHLGVNRLLLTKDYREVKRAIGGGEPLKDERPTSNE